MIKLDNIVFGYDKDIFDKVSLLIDNGITYVIGKNGSGKSTLGYILSGVKYLKSGSIFIDDLEVNKKTDIIELRKYIGIVFQNPNNQLLFNTVYDNLKFILDNMRIDKSEYDKYIDDALKTVDMFDYKYSNPYKMSMGQKQRIVIAGAIMLKPKYIIFDESSSMLDILGKEKVYEIIKNLKKDGVGVIFITNSLDELKLADNVLIIDNKKIFKYSKKELYSKNILKKFGLYSSLMENE